MGATYTVFGIVIAITLIISLAGLIVAFALGVSPPTTPSPANPTAMWSALRPLAVGQQLVQILFAVFLIIPLSAGVAVYVADTADGRQPPFGRLFSGFGRCYGKLVLAGLAVGAANLPSYLISLVFNPFATIGPNGTMQITPALVAFAGMSLVLSLAFAYLYIRLLNTLPLLADRSLDPPAPDDGRENDGSTPSQAPGNPGIREQAYVEQVPSEQVPAVQRRPQTLIAAVKRSWSLTRRLVFAIFAAQLLLGLVAVVSYFALCIGAIFIGFPLLVAFQGSQYALLRKHRLLRTASPDQPAPTNPSGTGTPFPAYPSQPSSNPIP
ncbi:MAG: hypothetical protein AAF108_07740 [Planctomycetota bacterium]